MCACTCRAAYFGLMTSIWAALPVEAVAGFVFSLYWPSSAHVFDEMAPEGTKNVVQGLGAFNFAAGKMRTYKSWCGSMIVDEMRNVMYRVTRMVVEWFFVDIKFTAAVKLKRHFHRAVNKNYSMTIRVTLYAFPTLHQKRK